MAGKIRHFMERNGRYFSRVVIPRDLRPYLDGKTELRAPLGGERSITIRKHPVALAGLMEALELAGQRKAVAQGEVAARRRWTCPALVESV